MNEEWLSALIGKDLAEPALQAHKARLESGLGPKWALAAESLRSNQDRPRSTVQGRVCWDGEFGDAEKAQLQQLIPWRKGPFAFGSIQVDTEWDSGLKWSRLDELGVDLAGKRVLDLGCGNGYYMWRMLERKPKWVLGVDPSALFHAQFQACLGQAKDVPLHFLAIGSDDLLGWPRSFDVLYCMGVLYHRKSPIDFLNQLRELVVAGGQIVLETLVLAEGHGDCICPYPSYAKMKNCYFVPSTQTLIHWCIRAGLKVVAQTATQKTEVQEQRATDWMLFQSLEDFLDPNNPEITVEGYPAPLRQAFLLEALR